ISAWGADIRGDFDCTGSILRSAEESALSVAGARIRGDVLLCDGFWALGEVWLIAAEVNGRLMCQGGTFVRPGGDALVATAATVRGADPMARGEQAVLLPAVRATGQRRSAPGRGGPSSAGGPGRRASKDERRGPSAVDADVAAGLPRVAGRVRIPALAGPYLG